MNLGIDRVSEEEICCCIDCQAEEVRLDVDEVCPSVLLDWHYGEEVLHVAFFHVEIGDLFADEVGSEHSAGVFPFLAVLDELA